MSTHLTDHFRKDASMQLDPRVALGLACERQARERELAALRRRTLDPTRTWRAQAGRTLIRVGRRLAADAHSTPAWSA
jgi:hypothetical protein